MYNTDTRIHAFIHCLHARTMQVPFWQKRRKKGKKLAEFPTQGGLAEEEKKGGGGVLAHSAPLAVHT